MKNKQAYSIFKLLKLKRVGHSSLNRLLKELPVSIDKLYDIVENNINIEKLNTYFGVEQIMQLSKPDPILRSQIIKLEENGSGFLTISDTEYPPQLLSGLKLMSPPILTYLGNSDLLQMQSVGFCGSRKASQRGLDVTRDSVLQLVKQDIAIVSGYAAGVDQTAHYTALESGGKTIIIIAEGIMNFKIRKVLKDVWNWKNILVISEFLPDACWTVSRAMQRNQTIIGLSNSMILIESGRNGGSMAAGNKTLEMRKKLYAPIYEGMPDFAIGNRILLDRGANPLMKSKNTGKANLRNLFNNMIFINEPNQIPLI